MDQHRTLTYPLPPPVNGNDGPPLTKLYSLDKSFSMSILVNEIEQPIYQPRSLASSNTGYIESRLGEELWIRFEDHRLYPTQALSVGYVLDGTQVQRYALDPLKAQFVGTVRGERESDISIRPFKFSAVKLTDDDDLAISDEKTIKGIGSIELRINRATIKGHSFIPQDYSRSNKAAPVLHEKQKKATLSHVTERGQSRFLAPTQRLHVAYLDPLDNPWITFKLLYRSRALLELEDIIPAPEVAPEPVAGLSEDKKKPKRPAEEDGVLYISDDDDDDDEDEPTPKIKAEQSRKKVKKEEREVITID